MRDLLGILRRLRKERGYTLKQVHEQTGITISNLSRIERGLDGASANTLGKLTQFYGVSRDILPGPVLYDGPSITAIVAAQYEYKEEELAQKWKKVVLQGHTLTPKLATEARNEAFGTTISVVVAHGWRDAWFVPGRGKHRGQRKRKWSAERTRMLFGED